MSERKPAIQKDDTTDRHTIQILIENGRKIIQLEGDDGSGDKPEAPPECPANSTGTYPCSTDQSECEEKCVYNGTCPGGAPTPDRCVPTMSQPCTIGSGLCWYINSAAYCTPFPPWWICNCTYTYVSDTCE